MKIPAHMVQSYQEPASPSWTANTQNCRAKNIVHKSKTKFQSTSNSMQTSNILTITTKTRMHVPKQLFLHYCTRFLLCTTNVANTQQTLSSTIVVGAEVEPLPKKFYSPPGWIIQLISYSWRARVGKCSLIVIG